jgi:hypothetical protein
LYLKKNIFLDCPQIVSNFLALEVNKMIKEGKDKKEALNDFMKKVLGSIDK